MRARIATTWPTNTGRSRWKSCARAEASAIRLLVTHHPRVPLPDADDGAVGEALRGARRALESGKSGALSFEFGNANVNSHTFFRDFWQLLTTAGFRLWRITPGGRELLVEEYYEDYEYFRSVSNFVAERTRPATA